MNLNLETKLHNQITYQTSTLVGHGWLPEDKMIHDPRKCPLQKGVLDKVKDFAQMKNRTVTDTDYCWKERPHGQDNGEIASNNQKTLYQVPFVEKLKQAAQLGKAATRGTTEYTVKFVGKRPLKEPDEVTMPVAGSVCVVRAMGRDEQSPIPLAGVSVSRLLDPYVSTTHLEHAPFTVVQLQGGDTGTGDSSFVPRQEVPIRDRLQFPTKVTQRVQPLWVEIVPHKGMKSEQQAAYRLPVDDLTVCQWHTGVEWPTGIARVTQWEALAPPNMYCTDYCHIGSTWPVRAAVDPGGMEARSKVVGSRECDCETKL